MRTREVIEEKLAALRGQLEQGASVVAEEEQGRGTNWTRLEAAIDDEQRLGGAIEALNWVLEHCEEL